MCFDQLIDWLIDRWFCHVDDDNYLNTDQLLQLLQKYNHTENWYLGKPSLSHPLEIQSRSKEGVGTCNLEEGGGGLWFYCNVVRFFWCFILMAYILFIWLFSFLTHCKTFLLNDNALTFPWKYQGTRSLKFIRIIQNIKARFWYFWLPVWMKFDKNCHCQRLP